MPCKYNQEEQIKAFWLRVKKLPSGCWEWQGSVTSGGYGSLIWDGKPVVAHRVSAYLYGLVNSPRTTYKRHGTREGSGHVLHKCDNRKCCSPNHFFIGNYSDNMIDAYKKGRKSQPKGSNHTNSKLSPHQIFDIRKIYAHGKTRQKDLAKKYNVSQRCISLITRMETYI